MKYTPELKTTVLSKESFQANEKEKFSDRDGDGIEDSIDIEPDKFSDEFKTDSFYGKIINRNGNTIHVTPNDEDGVRIHVFGGTEDAAVELLDIELELSPGTIIDADWG